MLKRSTFLLVVASATLSLNWAWASWNRSFFIFTLSLLVLSPHARAMDVRNYHRDCQTFVESQDLARTRFREALKQRDDKNYVSALLILNRMVADSPDDFPARSLRAAVYLDLKKFREAVSEYQYLYDHEGPTEANTHALARAFERNGQTGKAIDVLVHGTRVHPRGPRLAELLIEVLLRRSRRLAHLNPEQSRVDMAFASATVNQARLRFHNSKRFLELKASVHVLRGHRAYACLLIAEFTSGTCTDKAYSLFETKVQSSFPIGLPRPTTRDQEN